MLSETLNPITHINRTWVLDIDWCIYINGSYLYMKMSLPGKSFCWQRKHRSRKLPPAAAAAVTTWWSEGDFQWEKLGWFGWGEGGGGGAEEGEEGLIMLALFTTTITCGGLLLLPFVVLESNTTPNPTILFLSHALTPLFLFLVAAMSGGYGQRLVGWQDRPKYVGERERQPKSYPIYWWVYYLHNS